MQDVAQGREIGHSREIGDNSCFLLRGDAGIKAFEGEVFRRERPSQAAISDLSFSLLNPTVDELLKELKGHDQPRH
jgi:hypothetical protein